MPSIQETLMAEITSSVLLGKPCWPCGSALLPGKRGSPLSLPAAKKRHVSAKAKGSVRGCKHVISAAQPEAGLERGSVCAVSNAGVSSDRLNGSADDVMR